MKPLACNLWLHLSCKFLGQFVKKIVIYLMDNSICSLIKWTQNSTDYNFNKHILIELHL